MLELRGETVDENAMASPTGPHQSRSPWPIESTPQRHGPSAGRAGGGIRPGATRGAALPPDVRQAAAQRLRILGHPLRLQILELLAGGPRSVSDVSRLLRVEHQHVSKHLSELLKGAGRVATAGGQFRCVFVARSVDD